MTQTTPIRIQRTAPVEVGGVLTPSSTLAAVAERDLTASPGGRLYGMTPGGSRIVYSREQLMSLASSPLVHQPLQLRNGAQGIPPEIARRANAGDMLGSPEKSSVRGAAMLKSANAAAAAGGGMMVPLSAAPASSSPLRAASAGGRKMSSSATKKKMRSASGRGRHENGDADATVTTSDLENDEPLQMEGRRSRVASSKGGKTDAVFAEGGRKASAGGEGPRERGRDRQPRVSLGSLGAANQPLTTTTATMTSHIDMLPMTMDSDDPFGYGGGGHGEGLSMGKDVVLAQQLGRGHERGLSSSTASSLASGPPSKRSSISTEAPFVMEL